MEKKLINYFTNFQVSDLLGFAAILNVEEIDDFEEFVTNIVVAFLEQDRKHRRELLKLAKQISKNNKEYDEAKKVE